MRRPIRRAKSGSSTARDDLERGVIAVIVLMALVLVAIGIGAVAEVLSAGTM
ncbi:hypothetical protein [Devosia riboflavina]|uniref:hypothetical protein n=1 Tax=Devosia riboflavina TaxID=46914 RepID=UPI000A80B185|nr:hypothetical protein [Devosia riboflavina]